MPRLRYMLPAMLLCLPALADEPVTCNPLGTNLQKTRCALDDERQANIVLGRAYALLSSTLDADGREQLHIEQRRWIVQTDSACHIAANAQVKTGAYWPVTLHQCYADMTRNRTNAIADQLKKAKKRTGKTVDT